MANINDYIHWRGDLSFKQAKFNILDNLIFAEMAYLDYKDSMSDYPSKDKKKYHDVIEDVFLNHEKSKIVLGLIVPRSIVDLCDLLHNTPRYKDVYVSNYASIIDIDTRTQFSAYCAHIDENTICVSYRGTDDTLIGWQENVDMLYTAPTGAQVMAADYLETIAEMYPKAKFYLGGHSKGGNLANYAAIYASPEVQDRIIACYSNDGQGMNKKQIDMDKYHRIKRKIIRIIPQDDVVGMIFDPCCGKTIVCKSTAKGIYQHDAFSWQVNVTDFETLPDVSEKAKKLDKQITKIIRDIPEEDKKTLGKNLYDFITASQLNTLLDCKKESIKLLKHLNKFSGKTKQIFLQLVGEFMFY